jgi:hypothetical protein
MKYRPYYDVIGHPQQQQQQQQHITTPPIVLQPSYYFLFLNDLSARHVTYHSTTGPLVSPNVRINHHFLIKIASMSCGVLSSVLPFVDDFTCILTVGARTVLGANVPGVTHASLLRSVVPCD